MKRMLRSLMMLTVLCSMAWCTGCDKLQVTASSLISGGLGYYIATLTGTKETTTTYYLDGQEVDPADYGL